MARYINKDEFVAWVKEHWCADCQNDNGLRCRACWIDDAIDIVEEAPEADVVPKSEISETVEKIVSATDKVICVAKSEVARKIFEEIEKHLFVIAPLEEFDGQARLWLDDLMRIKKKYTEEPSV